MTNNMDEFDQDDIDTSTGVSGSGEPGAKKNLLDAWKSQPIFKLMVIMGVVGVAVAGVLGVFSGNNKTNESQLVRPPELNEAPGSKASPYFIEQSKQASAQRAEIAMQQGGSAMPTPVGQNADLSDLGNDKSKDQLMEFRAEAERLRQELRQEQKQNVQTIQQQIQQRPREQEDNTLAQAMQQQMQQLMNSWVPQKMGIVKGEGDKEPAKTEKKETLVSSASTELQSKSASLQEMPAIVAAGTVNYAQLLTEANSDVPSPILAQIVSGPLAGARAVGHFQVSGDYLVLSFNLATLKGKDYTIDAIALDPDTTLSGMASEVDHRYFTRVLLPAAGAFVSTFGSTLGQNSSTSTVSNGTVITDQAKQSTEDAIYAGIGQAGQTMSQFLQQQANQTKPLVRVAVGTPMGLFFLSSVKETDPAAKAAEEAAAAQRLNPNNAALLSGYNALQGASNAAGQGYSSQNQNVPYPNAYGNQTYGTSTQPSNIRNLTSGQYPTNTYNPSRY